MADPLPAHVPIETASMHLTPALYPAAGGSGAAQRRRKQVLATREDARAGLHRVSVLVPLHLDVLVAQQR